MRVLKVLLTPVLVILVSLAACSGTTPAPDTVVPMEALALTGTPAPAPTAAPTETPANSLTPEPTPTPTLESTAQTPTRVITPLLLNVKTTGHSPSNSIEFSRSK